jgi:hypothetical protein
MALTETKIKDLESKKFDELYNGNEAEWNQLAETAKAYTQENITDGKPPRPDDIAKVLLPMLQVRDDVRGHQEDHKARANRWVEWFVEYVIDRALLQGGN